jgi:hypothetical protein
MRTLAIVLATALAVLGLGGFALWLVGRLAVAPAPKGRGNVFPTEALAQAAATAWAARPQAKAKGATYSVVPSTSQPGAFAVIRDRDEEEAPAPKTTRERAVLVAIPG